MYISGKTFYTDVTRAWTAETGPGGFKAVAQSAFGPECTTRPILAHEE